MNTIYFADWPLSIRDIKRLGLSYLASQGYNTFIFDLSEMIYPKEEIDKILIVDKINGDNILKIRNLEEFKEAIGGIRGKKVVIANEFPTINTAGLFSVLHEHEIPYLVCNAGSYLPREKKYMTIDKIKRLVAGRPKRFQRYILSQLARKKEKRMRKGLPMPKRIFVNSQSMYNLCRSKYDFSDEIVVPSHVHDFDLCTEVKKKEIGGKEFCLFMDARWEFHNSSGNLNKRLVSQNKYYPTVNQFLDYVEKETGFSVVIAGHPRSHYDSTNNPFGHRQFIKGKSEELVAKSLFVILHGCTSFNFAVVLKKPALFIKTQEIVDFRIDPIVDVMANEVGQKTINIDRHSEVQKVDFSELSYSANHYARYLKNYICFKEDEERSIWEIVHETIKRDRLLDL